MMDDETRRVDRYTVYSQGADWPVPVPNPRPIVGMYSTDAKRFIANPSLLSLQRSVFAVV